MKCDEARTLLAVHRDLSRSQEHQLQLHLAGCPRCAAVKRELGLSTRLLSAMPEPGPAAVQRVVARAPLRLPEAGRPALRRGALTLSALALVAALTLFFWLPGQETPGVSGATTPEPTAPIATPGATLEPTPAPVESNAPVTITFHALMVPKQRYQPLAETFMAQNPDIHIRLVGLDEEVRTLSDSDTPDEYSAYLAGVVDATDSGWLLEGDRYDLRPFMWGNPDFQRSSFYLPAVEFVDGPGKLDRLPFAIAPPLLSYNRQLWAARGLPLPQSPLDTGQLLEAAGQLASEQDGTITTYGIFDYDNSLLPHYSFEAAGISRKTTPIEQLRLNTPAGVQALEQVADMLQRGVVLRGNGPRFPNYETLLERGQLGIWSVELDSTESMARRPFETGTLVTEDPRPWVLTYAISSGSSHPHAAWRWIAFLSSQDLDVEDYDLGMKLMPARRSVPLRSTHWSRLNPERERAVQLALQGRPLNPADVTPEFEAYIKDENDYLEHIWPHLEVAITAVREEGRSAQEALDQAQSRLDQRWPKGVAPTPPPSP